MPAWWRGKSKSSPTGKRGTGKKDKDEPPPPPKPGNKEKAKSFDEAVARKRTPGSPLPGGSLFAFDSDVERRTCHPLPRPFISSSTSLPNDPPGSAGASTSVSSVSSSGSSEETPDPGTFRYLEPVHDHRGKNVFPDTHRQLHVPDDRQLYSCSPVREHEILTSTSIPVSPRRDVPYGSNVFANGSVYPVQRAPTETMFNSGSRSPGPTSRGFTLPTSPVNPRVLGKGPETPIGKQDDLRSPTHPLPLPPGSPTSSASRSSHSKWKKGKLLGRGTFGRVYVGFNSGSGQMCAIKEVEVISDDSNSTECLKQLSQEINLLSLLSHPNIVQYYGSELMDDTLSVYLEYVSGGSIHKLLQEYGPFSEPLIRSYARQILSGLAYLHGMNVIHRDIKGANILVGPNGDIKLADFGMAKHISSYASIRSFKGSPYWMAPEVVMNTSGYSLPVDIWSLGCTIIEMATAKPPWSQHSGVQAIFKIGNSKDIPEIPDHLSNDGKGFLKLCLQREPSARPTAAQLMEHPFVRDQAQIKLSKANLMREAYPSSFDGTHSPSTIDFPCNRGNSPLHDRDHVMRHTVGCSPAYKNPSDLVSMRLNMSLPVSPCSSPLRQFKQSNWSCLPSPPHPAYTVGTVNYGQINYPQFPVGTSSRHTDHWSEIAQFNGSIPYSNSPRT